MSTHTDVDILFAPAHISTRLASSYTPKLNIIHIHLIAAESFEDPQNLTNLFVTYTIGYGVIASFASNIAIYSAELFPTSVRNLGVGAAPRRFLVS